MNVIMSRDNEHDVGGTAIAAGPGKYECDSCRAEFPNKTSADRHMLFCRTLAGIRRGGGGGGGGGGAQASVKSNGPGCLRCCCSFELLRVCTIVFCSNFTELLGAGPVRPLVIECC